MLRQNNGNKKEPADVEKTDHKKGQLTRSLSENIGTFRTLFKNDDTIVYRDIKNVNQHGFISCLLYIDGMIDVAITDKSIIFPIMNADMKATQKDEPLLDALMNKVISSKKITKSGDIDALILNLFYGDAVLLVGNFDEALIISCAGWKEREISEPSIEKILRGSKEGFTESLTTNLTMIRRKLRTPDLMFKFKEIGIRTKTKVCICYIDTLASSDILQELESRMDQICIDSILSSNQIEELIKDSPLAPFKTVGNTERPDVLAAKLLEGRIAVIVDGTPSALTVPFVFMEYFQTSDDYSINYWYASINRLLRCLSEFFATSIPAIYVALITYHQEMLPTPLLLSITLARQDVPFPTIIEALILLFLFEVIREAGIRMPSIMGQSVSIVGALVLGQAAIDARLFSAPMVVIVAATGITGLITIKLSGATIIIRLFLLLISAFMGLYGFIFGVIGAFIYLFSMRSFGVPYMLEYGSAYPVDLKDTAIRAPWWYMKFRPKQIAMKNIIRQKPPQKKEQ